MTRIGATRLALCAAALSSWTAAAWAQTFVSVAAGASTQAEGASDQPYLGPPFDGTSGALVAAVDRAAARSVAFGGEISLASAISGEQSQRAPGGSNVFVSEHRDTILSATVKIGSPLDAPAHVAFVLGGGVAQRHMTRSGAFNPGFGLRVSTPFSETLNDWAPAITLGVDLAVSLARRAALFGAARVHALKDDDRLPDGVVKRGVSSTIVRLGGGLQLNF